MQPCILMSYTSLGAVFTSNARRTRSQRTYPVPLPCTGAAVDGRRFRPRSFVGGAAALCLDVNRCMAQGPWCLFMMSHVIWVDGCRLVGLRLCDATPGCPGLGRFLGRHLGIIGAARARLCSGGVAGGRAFCLHGCCWLPLALLQRLRDALEQDKPCSQVLIHA